MRHSLKIVSINVGVFYVLLSLAYFSIPLQKVIDDALFDRDDDPRWQLPNYADVAWAKQHFKEFNAQRTEYRSFVGWRRSVFQGETITIASPFNVRRTVGAEGGNADTAYFFGGSGMWGTGADDANTIPSLFSQATGVQAMNFGEWGWTAHQSLNELIRLYALGHRPNFVVFYDGVNEVGVKCRHELGSYSHYMEEQISKRLIGVDPTSIAYYRYPLVAYAQILRGKLLGETDETYYNCAQDQQKALAVAEQLVTDWLVAKHLVESYGGVFIPILQPVLFTSNTRIDHINDNIRLFERDLRPEFLAVYPLIRKRMLDLGFKYDFTQAFDRDEYIYIDVFHVSPNGNRIISELVQAIHEKHSRIVTNRRRSRSNG